MGSSPKKNRRPLRALTFSNYKKCLNFSPIPPDFLSWQGEIHPNFTPDTLGYFWCKKKQKKVQFTKTKFSTKNQRCLCFISKRFSSFICLRLSKRRSKMESSLDTILVCWVSWCDRASSSAGIKRILKNEWFVKKKKSELQLIGNSMFRSLAGVYFRNVSSLNKIEYGLVEWRFFYAGIFKPDFIWFGFNPWASPIQGSLRRQMNFLPWHNLDISSHKQIIIQLMLGRFRELGPIFQRQLASPRGPGCS